MTEPPFWTTRDRNSSLYVWQHASFTEQRLSGSLRDVKLASGGVLPDVAVNDESANMEGGAASTDVPIVNDRVKTIEIVKRNGCYTLEEDGRLLTPSDLTRDEQLLSGEDLELFRRVTSDPGADPRQHAIRTAFESRKGGSSEGALNYTIGRPRVFGVESEAPEVSPLLLRVRLEEGELPPTRCKMTLRTVVIQGFDPNTRLQQVVDHSVRELRDVPVSSAQDAKSMGLLLPYPASATVPLQTTLISKRRTRDKIDSIRAAYDSVSDPSGAGKRKKEAFKPLLSASNDLVLKYVDMVVSRVASLAGSVASDLDRGISKAILWANMTQRLAEARSNTSYDYFTYGNASKSVFADLASDLDAISDVIQQESDRSSSSGLIAATLSIVGKLYGVQDPATGTIPLYSGLSERQRELVEYIVGRPNRRNQQFDVGTAVNHGTKLAHPRTEDELNIADASGMRKEYQMHHRIDTYIDIELWDPQYTDVIKMSIVPGLQAALEAGRLVQCEGAKLKQDFNQMARAARRLAD